MAVPRAGQLAPDTGELAAYQGLHAAAARDDVAEIERLAASGADLNALEHDRYDVLTIAAVRDDEAMVRSAIAAGADPRLVTSPYAGTAR